MNSNDVEDDGQAMPNHIYLITVSTNAYPPIHMLE